MVKRRGRKNLSQISRKRAFRKPNERILIVCEGEKTEKLYFGLYLDDLKAVNVDLKILGKECGSDPLSVVNQAKQSMRLDKQIDACFCVVDRDSHSNFDQAMNEAVEFSATLSNNRKFKSIASFPCFEFWLLMHFSYTRGPFLKKGKKSAGDCAVEALKVHLPKYQKNSNEQMKECLPYTDTAIENSKKALEDAKKTGEFNPSSEVHLIVEAIKETINRHS